VVTNYTIPQSPGLLAKTLKQHFGVILGVNDITCHMNTKGHLVITFHIIGSFEPPNMKNFERTAVNFAAHRGYNDVPITVRLSRLDWTTLSWLEALHLLTGGGETP
jgi:hypothetical protein